MICCNMRALFTKVNYISRNFCLFTKLTRIPCSPNITTTSEKKFCRKFSQYKKLPFEIDTEVTKDVILYRYENKRFFRILNFFGLAQCCFWFYLAEFAYSSLRDPSSPDNNKSWWQKLVYFENKYRNGMAVLFTSIGYVILVGSWMFTMRSVKYLVLLTGGKNIKIITYMPFAKHRTVEASLENISCNHSRNGVTSYLPIKLKGHWLYFLLDKRGTFTNVQLFDYTAGIKRKWK